MGVLLNGSVVDPFLDWLVGNASMAATGTRYVTVFDGNPQGAGSEVINTLTGSSNRIDLTAAMDDASGGSVANDTQITFTSSAVGAADVDFVAIYDAITGGNLLASVAVTAKSIAIGDGLRIAIGNLTIEVS